MLTNQQSYAYAITRLPAASRATAFHSPLPGHVSVLGPHVPNTERELGMNMARESGPQLFGHGRTPRGPSAFQGPDTGGVFSQPPETRLNRDWLGVSLFHDVPQHLHTRTQGLLTAAAGPQESDGAHNYDTILVCEACTGLARYRLEQRGRRGLHEVTWLKTWWIFRLPGLSAIGVATRHRV